jgi:hypothetical protein
MPEYRHVGYAPDRYEAKSGPETPIPAPPPPQPDRLVCETCHTIDLYTQTEMACRKCGGTSLTQLERAYLDLLRDYTEQQNSQKGA